MIKIYLNSEEITFWNVLRSLLDFFWKAWLVIYCLSSLYNWITGQGIVDEANDFWISLCLLIALFSRD